ncbi:MAG: hypothetical protein IPF53_15825 [Blastocatellia bacterium]|nr:hypothetical protein [Blastocatellia bacterium]
MSTPTFESPEPVDHETLDEAAGGDQDEPTLPGARFEPVGARRTGVAKSGLEVASIITAPPAADTAGSGDAGAPCADRRPDIE